MATMVSQDARAAGTASIFAEVGFSRGQAAAVLLGAADLAGDEAAEHVHVGTEDGEVFAVRHRGLAMVAVSERFTLGSLMIFDMRTTLRELVTQPGTDDVHDPRQVRSR